MYAAAWKFIGVAWFLAITAASHGPLPARRFLNTTLSAKDTVYGRIKPKVMIVNAFSPEADRWYDKFRGSGYGDLLSRNISVPGLSPIYPEVHCIVSGEICQLTVGESEINAAASLSALVFSPKFELSSTYFLVAGIAGVNPKLGTLGSVSLAKYVVQVALQYELDAREMPANFTTGYIPLGASDASQYPVNIYGTEVMKLSGALRDEAFQLASQASLTDVNERTPYRNRYNATGEMYAAARRAPSVIKCDTATSDVYYSGRLLGEAFENTTKIWTNQTDLTYCMTAQEDTAILQVLLRAHLARLVDYSRAIVLRSGANFDRPPPGVTAFDHLRVMHQGGSGVALDNMYFAGIEIVRGIVAGWDYTFAQGIQPKEYVGDVLGSLGGQPDFGMGSVFGGTGARFDGSTYSGPIKKTK
ncbi:hypothetical protein SUNI508_12635 [Seiridium unicorne]|uniref:Purine nucleoside permease n=1 Tax=Seiridium unicorne TaxID=138068 RepID=A0ABR2VH02_9PEZI